MWPSDATWRHKSWSAMVQVLTCSTDGVEYSYIIDLRSSANHFWSPWWHHQMETFSVLLALLGGMHRSLVDSPHKGQWRGALVFCLICAWTNGQANNRDAGDLRRHRAHYDVTELQTWRIKWAVNQLKAREVSPILHYWRIIAQYFPKVLCETGLTLLHYNYTEFVFD